MTYVIISMNSWIKKVADGAIMLILLGFLLWILFPVGVSAAEPKVTGWLPWFAWESGIESASENIRKLDTVYLFTYEIDREGNIVNKVDFEDDEWEDFFKLAKKRDVELIPTFAWFDGAAIHEVLSNKRSRNQLIEDIDNIVDEYNFDGANIDFEQKQSRTIDYFSRFLRDLEDELGSDDLTCAIEARMPPEHRWRSHQIPAVIEYANDYTAINRYCDRIEIMAYDQQRADILINDKRKGVPYMPVADNEWVETVLDLALEDFDEDKVYLGVPTYGRAWDVTVASEWYKDYTGDASLNTPRILELSEKYNAPIGRTAGGEAVISYFPEDSVWKIFNALPTPAGTPKGFEAAAKALLVATYADIEIPVRIVIWSDAKAIEDKFDIAEDYDLEGIAMFKIDGEEDQAIWDLFDRR